MATNPRHDRLTADGAENGDDGYGHGDLGKSSEALGAFTLIHVKNYNNKRATVVTGYFRLVAYLVGPVAGGPMSGRMSDDEW